MICNNERALLAPQDVCGQAGLAYRHSRGMTIEWMKSLGCHGALDVFSGKGGWVVGDA